jgi:hypothetical protein
MTAAWSYPLPILWKNYLFARAEERKSEEVQTWHSLTGVLESVDDLIKKEVTNKTKAVSLATDLETKVNHYAAVQTSTLRQLGVTQVRPWLLAALPKFSEKKNWRTF